jgi:GT2 family glycosyltransferase
LIIVNNGKQDMAMFRSHPGIVIVDTGKNLGWEGGLKAGLEQSDSEFVVFQNDDTFIPPTSVNLYQQLMACMADPSVAAVAPTTTVAAGRQSIYHPDSPRVPLEVSYLIFFTVMVRRDYLEKVGGIDDTLPGGDDIDLSIRFRQAGYSIVIDPRAFLIHHGFKTGTRVRGDHTTRGGWNSLEMTERTNQYLIRKHGFRSFIKTLTGLTYAPENVA